MIPRVKICCIADEAEAAMAIRCGADALGLVSAMPSGPGVLTDARIAEICRNIPPPIATFLLTCRSGAESIIDQLRITGCNTVQICDELQTGTHADIRKALPNVSIVQVIHIVGLESIEQAIQIAPEVDALLLDSGRPDLPTKELGGTGRTHDWSLSRRIRDAVNVPIFLAGGLNATNVAYAVQQVDPFGLDLCTGVRSAGKLDEMKLKDFFQSVGNARSESGS